MENFILEIDGKHERAGNMEEISSTQQQFLDIGKTEFLEHGFKGASLRQIVKQAGFTLGAFYGYYQSKEELFDALVKETADYIIVYIQGIYDEVKTYPPKERTEHMMDCFARRLPEAVDYLLEHREELQLLLTKAEGTRYENFSETMAAISEKNVGENILWISRYDMTFRLLIHAYYRMLIQVVLSGEDRENILKAMMDIQSFYYYGFQYFKKELPV